MSTEPTKTTCAWCGSTPLTREHLIPAWTMALLHETFGHGEPVDVSLEVTDVNGLVTSRGYQDRTGGPVVKAVCEPCNSGWMSQLEARLKPVLGPMICGANVTLDVATQSDLAWWVAKTVVLLNHLMTDDAVVLGPTDLEQIRDHEHAPEYFHIRLAHRPREWAASFNISLMNHLANRVGQPAAPGPEPNSFTATLALGEFVVAVAGGPGLVNPDRWVDGGQQPMMIWPPTMSGLTWPPRQPVVRGPDEVRAFHEGFWARIGDVP